MVEVVIVKVEVVSHARPIDALQLRRNQAEHHDHHDEHNSAGANAGSSCALALRLHVLDDFDYAPQDQQHRPVAGEEVCQPAHRQHMHSAQQEHKADDD